MSSESARQRADQDAYVILSERAHGTRSDLLSEQKAARAKHQYGK
ncbi:hypothetical protein PENANT_c007G06200 [Penicillium antarcticum]|uniref:Uncharacterized protein n=1 Tax=Penicillium antarcticum TaxID=416450 RepID=A0A1V6QBU9_9EURO|nr:hypothetical protein PENANT_c007G06200 [Penicillium antarcticum]